MRQDDGEHERDHGGGRGGHRPGTSGSDARRVIADRTRCGQRDDGSAVKTDRASAGATTQAPWRSSSASWPALQPA